MSVQEMTAGPQSPEAALGNSDLQARLRRVEGQVRGIERMIEERRACPDVLNQVTAARAALAAVARELVLADARRCVADPGSPEYASLVRSLDALVARS